MSLLEQILNTNIVNFIIVILTLAFIFKKAHLADIIERLADDIKANVEKSSFSAQSAISEYKTIKKQTKDTPKLQEEIINSAKSNAQNIKEKIEQKTNFSIGEIKANLEKIYSSQLNKQRSATINEVTRACVDLAQEKTVEMLDEAMQKQLVDSSIDELDKIQGGLK